MTREEAVNILRRIKQEKDDINESYETGVPKELLDEQEALGIAIAAMRPPKKDGSPRGEQFNTYAFNPNVRWG